MIRLLRRSRLLAVVLLLATPALGGAWLQAVHPCPVDAPWLEEHGHGQEHGSTSKAEGCHCISSCSASSIAVLATGAVSPAASTSGFLRATGVPAERRRTAPRPSRLLPPATAPPLS